MPSDSASKPRRSRLRREVAADRGLVAEQEAHQRRRGSRSASGAPAPATISTTRPTTKPIGETKNSRPPKAMLHLARGLEDPGRAEGERGGERRGRRRSSGSTRASRASRQFVAGERGVERRERRPSAPSAQPRGVEPVRHRRGGLGRQLLRPRPARPSRSSWRSRSSMRDSTASAPTPGLRRQRPAGDLRLEEGARPRASTPSPAPARMLARIAACAASGKLSRSAARVATPLRGGRGQALGHRRRPAGRRAVQRLRERLAAGDRRADQREVGLESRRRRARSRPGSRSRRPASGPSRSARSASAATSSMRGAERRCTLSEQRAHLGAQPVELGAVDVDLLRPPPRSAARWRRRRRRAAP